MAPDIHSKLLLYYEHMNRPNTPV